MSKQSHGEGLESYVFPVGSLAPSPLALNAGNLWGDVEDQAKYGGKRKHDEILNDELLTMLKESGLENMAVEVGTLQGGQIAALQGSRDMHSAGKGPRDTSAVDASPVAMTASAIFSPNPRDVVLPLGSPLVLKRPLDTTTSPVSMTASAIFSPNPETKVCGGLVESPAPLRGTDLREAASAAGTDTPPKPNPPVKPRRIPPQDIPPPEPVPPPPAPGGRSRRACTNYGLEVSSGISEIPVKRNKKPDPKPSKGLRHFSVKVCRKVEEKGSTSYNEVADELVRELALERDYKSAGEPQYDDKNIRRRVYDALNVLMAIGIISKDRKEIKWQGLPDNVVHSNIGALQREKNERERSLEKKKEQLAELLVQQIAFRNLARRNRYVSSMRAAQSAASEQSGGDGSGCSGDQDGDDVADSKIYMPFIVVSSRNDTIIQCEMAESREDVFFNFSNQFQIADDNEILKRLGMHKCRKQDLPVLLAQELISQVPSEVLIDDATGGENALSPSSRSSLASEYSPS